MKWIKDKLLWLYWNTTINTNWADFFFGGMIACLTTLIVFFAVSGTFSYISFVGFLITLSLFIKHKK